MYENETMNTNDAIDIEPTTKVEVQKQDLVDKALDFICAIGDEIKAHPIHTAATAVIGIFCYKKGKKKGRKTGWSDGAAAQYNHIRDRMYYMDDDGTKWNMIDAINEGKAEHVLIFSEDEKARYYAAAAASINYKNDNSNT